MPAEGFKSIPVWTPTLKVIDQCCAKLAAERGLPRGKSVSKAEAIDAMARAFLGTSGVHRKAQSQGGRK